MSDYTESTSGSSLYAQIVVPKYTLSGTVATSSNMKEPTDTPVTTGSSFLRLGTFPALTTTDSDLSGFENSLALAELVGAADAIATAEQNDDPAPEALPSVSTYQGDSNYLLGFSDDTRYHGTDVGYTFVDWVEVSNTTAVRKAETKRLLTKGGWWDHSDGNRISTTSGDKIEVIQGNYKMVILGRQDPTASAHTLAGTAFITDISGGYFEEQGPDPTPCIKTVEYVQSEGVWTLYQDNGSGNVSTKFDGKQADYYTGTRKLSYIGVDHETGECHTHTAQNLELVSKTWAKRIESYTGSVEHPVDHAFSLTYALKKEDITFAESVVASTSAISIAGTNMAGVDLVSVNVSPFMLTANACAVCVDVKTGVYYALGLNRTNVYGHSTTFEGGREVVTASMAELAMVRNELVGNASKLAMKVNTIAADVTNVNAKADNLSGSHNLLALDVATMALEIQLM